MKKALRVLLFAATAAVSAAALPVSGAGEEDDGGPRASGWPSMAGREALWYGVEVNLGYCGEALEDKDFKTLELRAQGVALVGAALARHGDGREWTERTEELIRSARDLAAASKREDAERSAALVGQLREQAKRVRTVLPGGEPRETGQPAEGLGAMMSLLEGTYADARLALTFGETDNAKKHAHVLSELGRLLSNYRNEAAWRRSSQDFFTAAESAATAEAKDTRRLKALLGAAREQCEACHRRRR